MKKLFFVFGRWSGGLAFFSWQLQKFSRRFPICSAIFGKYFCFQKAAQTRDPVQVFKASRMERQFDPQQLFGKITIAAIVYYQVFVYLQLLSEPKSLKVSLRYKKI